MMNMILFRFCDVTNQRMLKKDDQSSNNVSYNKSKRTWKQCAVVLIHANIIYILMGL